jgi:hypothetical protein
MYWKEIHIKSLVRTTEGKRPQEGINIDGKVKWVL